MSRLVIRPAEPAKLRCMRQVFLNLRRQLIFAELRAGKRVADCIENRRAVAQRTQQSKCLPFDATVIDQILEPMLCQKDKGSTYRDSSPLQH